MSIPIHVSNQKAYVWATQDVAILRSEHRICGTLTGTLPGLSQQNVFLGLPLLLMPEEVVFLVQNRIAVLIDDAKAHDTPTPEELKSWNDEREKQIEREIEEKERKRKGEDALRNRQIEPSDYKPAHTVVIATTSSSLPWYHPPTYDTLEGAKQAGIWSYPESIMDRARCGVFRELWSKGYFLGPAIKFGGVFLVYPGDPLRYHSHFVASVYPTPTSTLRPMDVVAYGRLGTATKKAHLLCGWDDQLGVVCAMFSIEWSGFG